MEDLQNIKQSNTSYSDEDLFVMMSFREDNEKEAKEAFSVLYSRYKNFLWNLCMKICKNEDLAKDVFNNTMFAVYKSYHTYDASKSKVSTWIARIAKNEMLDLLDIFKEKRIGEKTFIPLNENIYIPDIQENLGFETPQKKILDESLNTLSERERDILLTYMMYQDGKKHLSDETLSELRSRYETTSDNIRQIKKRALDKVKAYIFKKSSLLNK